MLTLHSAHIIITIKKFDERARSHWRVSLWFMKLSTYTLSIEWALLISIQTFKMLKNLIVSYFSSDGTQKTQYTHGNFFYNKSLLLHAYYNDSISWYRHQHCKLSAVNEINETLYHLLYFFCSDKCEASHSLRQTNQNDLMLFAQRSVFRSFLWVYDSTKSQNKLKVN